MLTGGIDLNVGPFGVNGQIAIKAPLGDISIRSLTGPSGVDIFATTQAKLQGLIQAEVSGVIAKLTGTALAQIDAPFVTIGGMLSLTSDKEDGVEGIKASLMGPQAIHDDSKLTITSDGAPNYRVLVKAPNYKQAEEELKSAVDMVLNILKKEGGMGSFERA